MSKSRAPQANWIIEAWEIHDAIADMAHMPDNLFNLFKLPELPAPMINAMEQLQDKLAAYLAYRMSRQTARVPPGKGLQWGFPSREHTVTEENEAYLKEVVGMDFSDTSQFALDAHKTIGKALSYRCLLPREKAELPLLVASLAIHNGRITRNQGVRRPRADRKSAMKRETELQIRNHYGESASQILVRLTGGVVAYSDGDSVTYWVRPGKQQTITRRRYENIFSEAKKAVDSARSTGRRLKKPFTG